jgi:uncharacterized protein (TIGR02996 family)
VSDAQAFLAAIRASPADDLPRLVYADWLDEHGQPERAEFIRVGCELANGSGWHSSPAKLAALARLTDRAAELSRHLLPSVWDDGERPVPVSAAYLDRGFLALFSCTFAWWLEHADATLPESAGLRVTLTTPVEWGAGLSGPPRVSIAGRGEEFRESEVVETAQLFRHDRFDLALCRLTWPAVASWEAPSGKGSSRPVASPLPR